MPLGPFDEFLAHQTSETFDHVAHVGPQLLRPLLLQLHSSSDELFVITGLGQYPNLGVTDAFITVSIGDEQHTVRASRELGSDRLDTVGRPAARSRCSRASKRCASVASPTSGASSADLMFTGTVAALEEPRTFIRRYGRVIQDVTRYAQVGMWEGTLNAAGRTFEVTPDRWKGARDRSWGVRPVGEPEAPGHPGAPGTQDGYGFRHDWLPMQFDDHMIKVQIDQDADGHRQSRSRCGSGTSTSTGPIEHLGRPEIVDRLPSRAPRDAAARPSPRTDPDGKPITVHEHAAAHAVPRRRFGLREPDGLGPRRLPGSAQGRGASCTTCPTPRCGASSRSSTRRSAASSSTPARSATACTRTCSWASTARPASTRPTTVAPA